MRTYLQPGHVIVLLLLARGLSDGPCRWSRTLKIGGDRGRSFSGTGTTSCACADESKIAMSSSEASFLIFWKWLPEPLHFNVDKPEIDVNEETCFTGCCSSSAILICWSQNFKIKTQRPFPSSLFTYEFTKCVCGNVTSLNSTIFPAVWIVLTLTDLSRNVLQQFLD